MSEILPPTITFEQNGQDFIVFFSNVKDFPEEIEYEIEDEYGRIIFEKQPRNQSMVLPKLGVGYYHLRVKLPQSTQDSLLIISPQKAFEETQNIKLNQAPSENLKDLYQALHENTDFHYQAPFPCFAEIIKLYKLKKFKEEDGEYLDEEKDFGLFLALKDKYVINRDFADWCNCCYDYNKINSYKSKEFVRQNPKSLQEAQGCINHLRIMMKEAQEYLHKRQKKLIAYVDSLSYVDYQSFLGWRDRKFLLSKLCKEHKNKVPYDSEQMAENFYDIFIKNIRDFMSYADILVIKDFSSLAKNICDNMPFPDKEITYDFTTLLAILKIESQRSRCAIWTPDASEQLEEFRVQAQRGSIAFIENF